MSTKQLMAADGSKLEVTTIKFDAVTGYMLVDKLDLLQVNSKSPAEAKQAAMLALLANTYVVRSDAEGNLEKIELTSVAKINRACDFKTLMLVIRHAVEVNYGNFFDESDDENPQIQTPSP